MLYFLYIFGNEGLEWKNLSSVSFVNDHYLSHTRIPSVLPVSNEVREFIRSHEVNEYEVAAHFDIPIGQVKAWIKEGRIEYKENSTPSIMGVHCQRCGAPVSFGTLCPKCLKVLNGNKGYGKTYRSDNHKMRYVDQNDDSN